MAAVGAAPPADPSSSSTAYPFPSVGNGGTGSFEYSPTFQGERPGMVFKLDHLGLGYYKDVKQTLIPQVREQLPERWREVNLREEQLVVHTEFGAGLSLEPSDFGFAVAKVGEKPGQPVAQGDVIVAVEGRLFVGISGDQMQASFLKRRVHGARLTVANLEEVKALASRDPAIIEGWDARHGRAYYFHKKTGKSGWTIEELQQETVAAAVPQVPQLAFQNGELKHTETNVPEASQAPIDIAHFMSHGFARPKEEKVKKKQGQPINDQPPKADESDLARAEKRRWNDWNEGGRGGYTEQFLDRYRNTQAFPAEPKPDKRLKGSVGPGLGMDKFDKWTGSKNSFY